MKSDKYTLLMLETANLNANRMKLQSAKRQLQNTNVLQFGKKRKIKKEIQALQEGERSVLSTYIALLSQAGEEVDKNNYTTYSQQVTGAYDMYEARSNYGAELLAGLIDMRVAFIAGDGISYTAKNKATEKYIEDFLTINKLKGKNLIEFITTSELEGRNLLILDKAKKKTGMIDGDIEYIKVTERRWEKYRYDVKRNDIQDINKISYKEKTGSRENKEIPLEKSVYVEIGRRNWNNDNETPTRIHKVLTDIENFSRAKYDLRKNTHIFGKVMPYWETQDVDSAKSINAGLDARSWEIGDGYAGTGKFSLVEPSGSAGKSILDDAVLALKCISTMTGIPVHWLAWPELMSNRATADNLMEVVVAATKRERLVWEEAIKELIYKSMIMAANAKIESNEIISMDFDIQLPVISIALMKQVMEVFMPLRDSEEISSHTLLTQLPGSITYEKEKTYKEKEAKDKAKSSPFHNHTTDDMLNKLREGNDDSDETTLQPEGAEGNVRTPGQNNTSQ